MNARALCLPLAALFPLMRMAEAGGLATPNISCKVENTSEATTITATAKGSETPVVFRIEWAAGDIAPGDFKNRAASGGSITSTHRFGETTVTRTILASAEEDCLFIHVTADKPGAVGLRAHFIGQPAGEIRDRREILFNAGKVRAHAWVIPFESDVGEGGKGSITVSGEGEALVILNLTNDPTVRPVSGTYARLGRKYDPGHTPPNPHLVWEGVNGRR